MSSWMTSIVIERESFFLRKALFLDRSMSKYGVHFPWYLSYRQAVVKDKRSRSPLHSLLMFLWENQFGKLIKTIFLSMLFFDSHFLVSWWSCQETTFVDKLLFLFSEREMSGRGKHVKIIAGCKKNRMTLGLWGSASTIFCETPPKILCPD